MLRKGFTRASIVLLFTANLIFPSPAKAANCTPQITSNGNQTVVAFKTVGTCTWSTPAGLTTFKGLIIGGGGGGGSAMGGGGGGGGYVSFDSLTATSDVFTIVVGDGGAGAPTGASSAGNSGGNSGITGNGILLTSRGGAGGSTDYSQSLYPARLNGGSGGGSSGANDYPGAYPQDRSSLGTQTSQTQTPSLSSINGAQFGFNGSAPGPRWYPGGGGGAGGSGSNSPATGGVGRANSILGTNYYWAGGGGGSGWSGVAGSGGNGGGGGGGTNTGGVGGSGGAGLNSGSSGYYVGGSGATNTGGGGGAGTHSGYAGGNGGSGIVILSYLAYVGPASISLQLGSSATSAVYRTTSTIEALVDVPGKVTFYQAGKTISGCRNKATSGSSPNIKATCTWKPSNRGSVKLTARITPSSANYSATTSSIYAVPVGNRTTPR